jgi:hypothetical protein
MTLDNTKVIFCLIILFGSNINSNNNDNQPTHRPGSTRPCSP